MANSKYFTQLTRRVSQIENSYLPEISQTGNYTSKQRDDLRAYVILIHAELEAYFEQISEAKAKEAFQKWKLYRTKSNVLTALVCFCKKDLTGLSLEKRLNDALTDHIRLLKANNGIKEENLRQMLLPLGLEDSNIDTTWLSTMSSFGSERGKVAHSTAMVQQPLDPQTIKSTVALILSEVRNIDVAVKKLS